MAVDQNPFCMANGRQVRSSLKTHCGLTDRKKGRRLGIGGAVNAPKCAISSRVRFGDGVSKLSLEC